MNGTERLSMLLRLLGMRGMAPPEKQETNMTEFTEISMDELDAVSGGAPGLVKQTLSIACEALGNFAAALGQGGPAYSLLSTAEQLLH
jgi:hypothetical protein